MRILVLSPSRIEGRKTITDHLYSFKRYVKGVEFFYCDVQLKIPSFLKLIDWDGIILHYSLLADRFDPVIWEKSYRRLLAIKNLSGFKVAMPQDEYIRSSGLCSLFKQCQVDTVFTCAEPVDYDTLYPLPESGLKHRITTFTGFVDEDTLQDLERLAHEVKERDIDIGYRARNLPYWVGRHGQIKGDIAKNALEAPNTNGLRLDISTKASDVLFGDLWTRFLLRCRVTLGCLGGSSLHDPDGTIHTKVEKYVKEHPHATFEEVEKSCFPGKDGNLHLFAISPRHFECAMAKTCQVLVEGDYQGVLEPDVHYIPLKKDFSNFQEVFDKVANKELCDTITENAYRDLVASGKYTYSIFANSVIDHIRQHRTQPSTSMPLREALVRSLLSVHAKSRKVRLQVVLAYTLIKKLEFKALYRLCQSYIKKLVK